jgi:hypothetical protein
VIVAQRSDRALDGPASLQDPPFVSGGTSVAFFGGDPQTFEGQVAQLVLDPEQGLEDLSSLVHSGHLHAIGGCDRAVTRDYRYR